MNYIEIIRETARGEVKIIWTNGGLGYSGKALEKAIERIKNYKGGYKSYKVIELRGGKTI